MNIRHECPLPDLSFTVAAPLFVTNSDGTVLTVKRWSLAGIWIEPAGHDLASGAMLCVPFQGVDVSFAVNLSATEDPEHFVFRDLTVRQRETLAVFYRGVLSGKMVPTGDMIASLDTPVDLVPMGETEDEKAAGEARVTGRSWRIAWNLALYAILAVFLVSFVGGKVWQRLSFIPLDHGRFFAPIDQHMAPDAGYIDRLFVRPGETVKRGDIIARLEDPDRESDVEDVRAQAVASERLLADAEARLAQHMADKPRFRAPFLQDVARLTREVSDHHPGTQRFLTGLADARDRLAAFDNGVDAAAGGFHAVAARLSRAVEESRSDLRRWKRELRHRKSAADRYVVRARNDGTVFAVHVAKGHYVGRGDLIAEIEQDTPRTAVGWLDDDMVTSVSLGMRAHVRFNFRGEHRQMTATVVDLQAGADTVRPDRFGMLVTLKVDKAGLKTSRKLFRPNAPAKLELDRNLTGYFDTWGSDEGS